MNEGLSMGTITGIQKDVNGYIWIATAEGLHRYDGIKFKILKHKEKDTNSLSDSYISCIVSHENQLFIGNNSGQVDIMNVNDHSFSRIIPKTIDPNFDFPITAIDVFNKNVLIGTAGGGLFSYDIEQNKLEKVETKYGSANKVLDLLVTEEAYYTVTSSGIYRNRENTPIISEDRRKYTCIAQFNNGFLIGSENGIQFVSDNFDNVKEIDLPKNKRLIKRITGITSNKNEAWIATLGGLMKYDNSEFSLYTNNVLRPFSLVENHVNTIFIDDQDIVWAGTVAGLSRYSPHLKRFNLLQYFDYKGITYNNNVYATYEDSKGFIWLGTLTSGIFKLNPNKEIVRAYPVVKTAEIETRAVRAFFEDSKGRFWVGTRDDGVFLFDRSTEQFTAVANTRNKKLKHNAILAIYEDLDGEMWFGSYSGLYNYNVDTKTTTHYLADSVSKSNNLIYQLQHLPNTNTLFIASFRGGIQLFDKESHTFRFLKHNSNDSLSLSNNSVMCFEWINSDTALIGTYGGGMNIFNLKTEEFTHVTEEDGLPNNVVYGIVYEGKGNCWMSTNNGLVRYNIYRKNFDHFEQVHNLQSTEFNEGAFLKTRSGEFLFGGVNGLNYFSPSDIYLESLPPSLVTTEIQGEFINHSSNSYSLSYLNSRLEIEFKALDYSNPEGLIYEYKLEGYDNNWIKTNAFGSAVYPRLSSGNYTFKLKAKNEFDSWSTEIEDIVIYVKPPFWQRWWFISLAVLGSLFVIYLFLSYRTKEIEKTYKLQLVDSELAALRSQMNPHFIFNSLNSIQYFILKKEPKEAYTYLSKFASLMRKILQNSRLKYINVGDEVDWLNLYLEMEKMRMDDELDYSIETNGIENLEQTYMPTMLIQPFVENSIVHGLLPKEGERKLKVTITKAGDTLLCNIEDNGIGRKAADAMNAKRKTKHNSAGMSLTKKRLQILSDGKGDYKVDIFDLFDDTKSLGTRVEMTIPIIKQID